MVKSSSNIIDAPPLKRTTTMKAPSTINSSASQRNLKKPTTETKTAPAKRYGVASGLSKSYATGKPTNASEKKPEPIKK